MSDEVGTESQLQSTPDKKVIVIGEQKEKVSLTKGTSTEKDMQDYRAVKQRFEENRKRKQDLIEQTKIKNAQKLLAYEEKLGHPPDEDIIQRLHGTVIAQERGLAMLEDQLAFIRPRYPEDVQYRNEVLETLPQLIADNTPEGLPLRFHGAPIYNAMHIIESGGLLSSQDRLGIATSFDSPGTVSVTTPHDVISTIQNRFTGLYEEGFQIPAGCIFVLLPNSERDELQGSLQQLDNVSFREHPEQLYRVLA